MFTYVTKNKTKIPLGEINSKAMSVKCVCWKAPAGGAAEEYTEGTPGVKLGQN